MSFEDYSVPSPLEFLWKFQQDQARTNLLGAQTEDTKASTAQKIMQTLMQQRVLNSDLALQDAMTKGPQTVQDTAQPPPVQDADPQQYGAGAVDQFMQSMGGAPMLPPQQSTPMPKQAPLSSSPIQQARSLVDQRLKQASYYDFLASQPNVIAERKLDLAKKSEDIRKSVQDDQAKIVDMEQKQAEAIGGVAGAAAKQGTLQALQIAASRINSMDPTILQRLPGVDRYPDTGELAPTPKTFAALDSLGNMSMKQSEQLKAQHDVDQLAREKDRDADLAAASERTAELRNKEILHADQRTAATQAGANQRNAATIAGANARAKDRLDMLGDTLGLKEQKEARLVENQTDSALQSDPVVKNIDKFEKSYNAAKNVFQQLDNPNWLATRKVTAAAADDMMREYAAAIQNYRATAGNKFTTQDQEKYSSVLQKMNAFASTIGQGKKPDVDVMRDVAGEINRLYNEQNAMAVQRTLQARAKVYNQGGDPNNVRSPANIDRAIQYGAATKVKDPETGIEYLKFGTAAPSATNTFPIYTQPKEKKVSKRGAALLNSMIGEEDTTATAE